MAGSARVERAHMDVWNHVCVCAIGTKTKDCQPWTHTGVCVQAPLGVGAEGARTLLAAAQLSLHTRYLLSPTITEGRSDGCGGAEESAGPPAAPAEVRARVMNFSSSSMSSPTSERERRMRKGGEPWERTTSARRTRRRDSTSSLRDSRTTGDVKDGRVCILVEGRELGRVCWRVLNLCFVVMKIG